MLDVSVVVPFFNPGANLDDCLASLINQTLAHERYEIVLVDDGSTDGSDRRAQRYAEAHPELIRVLRIPASGWPGRPRNVGVDNAQGSYVQFVDSDDAMHPEALERLLEIALSSDADLVVGKLTSDFRGLHHPVFRHTVTGRTIDDYPLVETLTPHKMVRRDLLVEHAIRFAEGPRHVEDEHFSMQVYTYAKSVAVVGDLPCYFYRRRRVSGRNLGDTQADPADYYRDLAAVLDVVDSHVADPEARVPLQRRFYRNEMLGRLRGQQMRSYPDDYRQDLFDRVRKLAAARFTPAVHESLGCFVRTQSRLVTDDDVDGATAYADWLAAIRLQATATEPVWRDGRLVVEISASLVSNDVPLALERDGGDWCVPQSAAPEVPRPDRLVTSEDLTTVDLDCATVSRADAQLWSTTEGLRMSIGETGEVAISGTVSLDPLTLCGGRPLSPGLWDLRLRVMFGGLTTTSPLRPVSDLAPQQCQVLLDHDAPMPVQPYWTSPNPTLAIDIGEWSHPLTDLLKDATPSLHRRTLRLPIPAITGGPVTLPAQVILVPIEEATTAIATDADLVIETSGATLRAKLPRHLPLPAHVWVRIGEPGGSPARKLALVLTKEGLADDVTVTPA
jgi:poly(ribitol-phosphate) beta-N-acetylglucosaminyltransferase